MRPRREVIADWAHGSGQRVPIVLGDRGGFEFGEPAVAYEGERTRYGVIGWDPGMRWVLVLDEARGASSGDASSGDASSGDASSAGDASSGDASSAGGAGAREDPAREPDGDRPPEASPFAA